jgi:DNA-binding PadR family transcriptional regulator
LIKGQSAPKGKRRRTVYALTPAGREVLREWLLSPEMTHEVRDEARLKLFFASVLEPEQALELLRTMRRRHAETLASLRAIESSVNGRRGYPYLVLESGIALHECMTAWCDQTEARLLAAAEKTA